jgi:hypothetical protein
MLNVIAIVMITFTVVVMGIAPIYADYLTKMDE